MAIEGFRDGVTLFCDLSAEDHLMDWLRREELALAIEDSRVGWSSVEAWFDDGALRITKKTRTTPGDDFSRIMLGMRNWIKRSHNDKGVTREISARVVQSELMLGVAAIPAMPLDGSRWRACVRLTEALGALAFDGFGLYEGPGAPLIGVGE